MASVQLYVVSAASYNQARTRTVQGGSLTLTCCNPCSTYNLVLTSAPIQDPKWTPIPKINLEKVNINEQGTQCFGLREIIPQTAREVLLYVVLSFVSYETMQDFCWGSSPNHISILVASTTN